MPTESEEPMRCAYVVRRVPSTLDRPFEQFEQWCGVPIRKKDGPCVVCSGERIIHGRGFRYWKDHHYDPGWVHYEVIDEGSVNPVRIPRYRVYENDATHFGHPATPPAEVVK